MIRTPTITVLLAITLLTTLGVCQPANQPDPEVSRLINKLLYGDQDEGKDAGRALIRMGRRGVPALIVALNVDTTKVRYAPGAVLSSIGDSAIPDIVTALARRNPVVTRHNAALALNQDALGSERLSANSRTLAVQALTTALDDPSPDVRESAAHALPSYGHEAESSVCTLVPLLNDHSSTVRSAAASAIGDIGSPACGSIEKLISTFALDSDSHDLGYRLCFASSALAKLGAPAVEGLKKVLAGGATVRARSCAADAIGEMKTGDASAISTLAQALQRDPSPIVEERAAQALGEIGIPAHDAVAALQEALANRDDYVRMTALEALGKMGEYAAKTVPDIVQKLTSNDYATVRQAAVQALVDLGASAQQGTAS